MKKQRNKVPIAFAVFCLVAGAWATPWDGATKLLTSAPADQELVLSEVVVHASTPKEDTLVLSEVVIHPMVSNAGQSASVLVLPEVQVKAGVAN